jgi:hypothetical protein
MVFQRTITALALFASMVIAGSTLSANPVDNNIHEKACTITSGNYNVTLNIEPKPVQHMKELTFSVTVKPCDKLPDTLQLDLSMPGMEMGKNQVTLIKKSGGLYEGKGIIVRCMSGRTLWRATIISDELKNPAFTFNVRE